jgi:hypothetical protein
MYDLPCAKVEAKMKPKIEKTKFGSITVGGIRYGHDLIIRLNGKVEKRKKKLSKEVFGTSHVISLAEAEYVYGDGAAQLIIGGGQRGTVSLSDEAARFFEGRQCAVLIKPMPEVIQTWNEAKGAVIGLFHITC